MRRITVSLSLLLAAAPAVAQQAKQQARESDPTRKVAGGALPAGWQVRLDDKDTARYKVSDTKLAKLGTGWRVTSGPAALYYNPAMAPTSEQYTVRAVFASAKAPRHPEAYGIFITGKDLADPDRQSYAYLLVRGDGRFLLNHRAGKDVHKIRNWEENAAVHKRDASGKVRDELVVKAASDSVRFFINGTPVAAIERQYYGDPRGITGLRVNHNLDVRVERFEVAPGAK